jgi:hypothetical protein
MDLFGKSIEKIKERASDFDLGWRFLCTAEKTLTENDGIFLITMNPGGDSINKEHGIESCEDQSAYLNEKWGNNEKGEHPLQKQIITLFEKLASKLGVNNHKDLMNKTLCGYFIPYRSAIWANMPKEKQEVGVEIGKAIWKPILETSIPRIIICIDQLTHKNIKGILNDLKYVEKKECNYPTGWGNIKASIARFELGDRKLSVLRLPHLSRFGIFNRPDAEIEIDEIIEELIIDYK